MSLYVLMKYLAFIFSLIQKFCLNVLQFHIKIFEDSCLNVESIFKTKSFSHFFESLLITKRGFCSIFNISFLKYSCFVPKV